MIALSLLLALVALALFGAIFLAAYAVTSASAAPANYLGIRGLKRARALHESLIWGQFEPLVRWLGTRISPLLPEAWRARMNRQIVLAGDHWGLQPEEYVALSVLSCVACGSLGSLYGWLLERGPLYAVVGALVGAMLPYLQMASIEQERRKRVQNGLPHVIDLLSLGLSAGLDFPGSLRQLVDKTSRPDDPLIEELGFILQELQVGKTRKQALLQFAERVPGETVREFVGSIVQAEERGNPLDRVLQIQAEVSRQRRSVRAEEAAAKAGVKILAPMLLVFSAVLLLIVAPMVLQLSSFFGE